VSLPPPAPGEDPAADELVGGQPPDPTAKNHAERVHAGCRLGHFHSGPVRGSQSRHRGAKCGTRRRLVWGNIVTAAMLAWTMGSLLAVGLVVVGVLVAYAIYYLVFRLGK